jgi:hypothetical protein
MLIFDLSTPYFEEGAERKKGIAEIAMSSFDWCAPKGCHSEHREEPMRFNGAGKMHGSFASPRMTRCCQLGFVNVLSQHVRAGLSCDAPLALS